MPERPGLPMQTEALPIPGLHLARQPARSDHRGAFARWFCAEALAPLLGGRGIVQINHSRTVAAGSVRGLHFQHAPHAEMKLVRCIRGRVRDVVLDLRAGSPTLLRHVAVELAEGDGQLLVVPEGCAHGFQTLVPDTELLYLHTAAYAPQAEAGVRFDDPRLGIAWPLPVAEVSARDRAHPLLPLDFAGVPA